MEKYCPKCRGTRKHPNALHLTLEDYYVCSNEFHGPDNWKRELDDCKYALLEDEVIIAPWQKGGYWRLLHQPKIFKWLSFIIWKYLVYKPGQFEANGRKEGW